jgi:glycosyltransferase involved in cell wall biosynthesis
METPLVTVICISYNHAPYVYQALVSLYNQQYEKVEVIIADDCSTDETQMEIKRFLFNHPVLSWKVLYNVSNLGNCKTFNEALRHAKGKYIIDFAADDLLYTTCIAKQVEKFEKLSDEYGVVFTNVDLVDAMGNYLTKHYTVNEAGKAVVKVPTGEVYRKIVRRYFISPVGVMMRRSVLDYLGGYDESLAYEDFDFWIRSSRIYKYAYVDECLVAKRIVPRSLSTRFKTGGHSRMFESTARICQKIAWLNKTEKENEALLKRIRYEIKQAIRYRAPHAVFIYVRLMKDLGVNPMMRFFYRTIAQLMT